MKQPNNLKSAYTPLDQHGYSITPANGKIPVGDGWGERPNNPEWIEKYPTHNVGIVLGKNLVAIDVDIFTDVEINKLVCEVIEQQFIEFGFNVQDVPRRIGVSPKCLYLLQIEQPIAKHKIHITSLEEPPKIAGGKPVIPAIEFLGNGQQFITYGIHPDTKKPYQWTTESHPVNTPLADLPKISIEQFYQLFDAIANELRANNHTLRTDDKRANDKWFRSLLVERDDGATTAKTISSKNPEAPTNDNYSESQADSALRRCVSIIEQASAGNRHDARFKAAKLAGGYLAGGLLKIESVVFDVLLRASDSVADNGTTSESEKHTLRDGINKGKNEAIYSYDSTEFRADLLNGFDAVSSELLSDIREKLNQQIVDMNKRYALILHGSKVLIMKTIIDETGRNKRTYLSTESFIKLHMNKRVIVGIGGNNKPIKKDVGTAWLEHESRLQYTDGIVFVPSQYPNGIEKRAAIHGEQLNLWQGYSIEQKQHDGALERIYSHIQDVICSGDSECNEYLLNWIARCFQYPDKNGQVAVALKGEKGCGKSTLGKFIKSIFGQYALQVTTPKHLIGNFNAHMADCCFLFADEVFFAGDKAHENILKGLITEPNLMIERKGVDAVEERNRIKLLMASNNDWIAPSSKDERRYFVLDVSSKKIGDSDYFNALHSDIDSTDVQAAFLYEMLHRDISKFNVGKVPDTDALKHQRMQSLDSFGRYWFDVMQRGFIFETQQNIGDLRNWNPKPASDLIRAGYKQWCDVKKIGQFQIASDKAIGTSLTQWYGAKRRLSGIVLVGENNKGELLTNNSRPSGYEIGTHEQAIQAFCKAEKLNATELLKHIDVDVNAVGYEAFDEDF